MHKEKEGGKGVTHRRAGSPVCSGLRRPALGGRLPAWASRVLAALLGSSDCTYSFVRTGTGTLSGERLEITAPDLEPPPPKLPPKLPPKPLPPPPTAVAVSLFPSVAHAVSGERVGMCCKPAGFHGCTGAPLATTTDSVLLLR